jgi:hypothetical protein
MDNRNQIELGVPADDDLNQSRSGKVGTVKSSVFSPIVLNGLKHGSGPRS